MIPREYEIKKVQLLKSAHNVSEQVKPMAWQSSENCACEKGKYISFIFINL